MVCINISQLDICSISSLGMIGTVPPAEVAIGLESPLVPPWIYEKLHWRHKTRGFCGFSLLMKLRISSKLGCNWNNLSPNLMLVESLPIFLDKLDWGRRISFICVIGFRFESCSFYQGLLTSDVTRIITRLEISRYSAMMAPPVGSVCILCMFNLGYLQSPS